MKKCDECGTEYDDDQNDACPTCDGRQDQSRQADMMVKCNCGERYHAQGWDACPRCGLTQKGLAALQRNEARAEALGSTSTRSKQDAPREEVIVSTESIQVMEKTLKSALLSANTEQTEYLRKIHFWMRYFGIVTVAGGVIAILLFVITVANAT